MFVPFNLDRVCVGVKVVQIQPEYANLTDKRIFSYCFTKKQKKLNLNGLCTFEVDFLFVRKVFKWCRA